MSARKLINLFAMVATLVLGGCGSTKYQDLSISLPTPPAGQARVVFLRNSSFVDATVKPAILLDDVVVGTSQPGNFFYVETLAGPHTVATSNEAESSVAFVLADGETRYVKTGGGFGPHAGHVVPELVSAERARGELPELEYGAATTTRSLTNARPAAAVNAGAATAMEPESTTEVIPVPALSYTEPAGQGTAPPPLANQQGAPANPTPATPAAPAAPTTPITATDNAAAPVAAPVAAPLPDTPDDKFQLGKSSTTVETLLHNEQKCEAVHGAELLSSDGPLEHYREQCRDGRIFMVRCEFRQCVLAGQQR